MPGPMRSGPASDLPTEEEWQLAAQGADGRNWPWGRDYDPARCNTTGRAAAAKSYAAGKSPYGCYQMTGNVWELTESERTDGHSRFLILRGGCFLNVTGSPWYMTGGPRPLDYHAKFLQMWPGLDRAPPLDSGAWPTQSDEAHWFIGRRCEPAVERFAKSEEANGHLEREYRKDYELPDG